MSPGDRLGIFLKVVSSQKQAMKTLSEMHGKLGNYSILECVDCSKSTHLMDQVNSHYPLELNKNTCVFAYRSTVIQQVEEIPKNEVAYF